MSSQRAVLEEVLCHFSKIVDPRSTVHRKHPLSSVIMIAVLAVLAGAAGPTAIALWAETNAEFLLGVLALPNGIPRQAVDRRLLCVLKPTAFQGCFMIWIESLRRAADATCPVDRPILAVDTIAGAGSQKAIAVEILEEGCDDLLAVKDNQPNLKQAIIDFVTGRFDNEGGEPTVRQITRKIKRHGRKETREVSQFAVPESFRGRAGWRGLATVGFVKLTAERDAQDRATDPGLREQSATGSKAARARCSEPLGDRKQL